MQRSSLFIVLAAALALAGCAPEAKIRYAEKSAVPVVAVGTPTLVAIAPDVWVLEDADHAVYYTHDRYWVSDRERWFESFTYEAGWTPVDTAAVPDTVVNRNHAYYTQYRGEASAERRRPPTTPRSSIQAQAASSAPGGSRHE